MLNADVTLRRVICELNEWASSHGMIEKFMGYGQFLQTQMESERSYPLMVVNVTSAPSENWYINYQFEIMVLDWVGDEQTNRPRVMSDTRQILNDLEETISYSNRWQDFSKIKGAINCIPAIEKGRDKSFGWILTFTLGVKKRHGICDLAALMPEYDFEQGVVVPSCNPVTSTLNTMPITPTPSGGNKAITLVDTLGDPFTDFTKTVDTASELEIEIDAVCAPVTSTFNTDPLISTPSGGNKDILVLDPDDNQVGTLETNTATDTVIRVTAASVIAYNTPPSYVDATVYTYDEYWQILNGSNPYTVPSNGRLAVIDPTNYYMLLTLNSIGNYCRFVNPLKGYYDGYTDTYHLLDGTPSTRAVVFKADDFVRDHSSRLGYRTRRSGSGTTQELANAAQLATWNGLAAGKWFLPTAAQMMSIHNYKHISNPLYAANNKVFEIELSLKTCTPNLDLPDNSYRYEQSISGTLDSRPNNVNDAGAYVTYETLPGEIL